ncbi:MAG TPA: tetratricopeptide repeat protein [Terriglobales bacterium]|nr:tetratricopeptide repeat protein [Terriglobales bacterium]
MNRACFLFSLLLTFSLLPLSGLQAQSNSELVQVTPPPIRRAEPPNPDATAAELETLADQFREQKDFLDALDYFRAAISKNPKSPTLYNKLGITELMLQHYRQAKKSFERALKLDPQLADAYNNLGVDEYEQRRYGKALKMYDKALTLRPDTASYYSNLGAAYYARQDWEKAGTAYTQALQIDPSIFERTSHLGVAAQVPPSMEERGHFDYMVAKILAKQGDSDRSLQYLKRAMEEGYNRIQDVYKDPDFAQLRSDTRFTQLMASRPPAIPE